MSETIFEKARAIHLRGYYIGPRDPNRNVAFKGAFMVCEDPEEGPTQDAGNGGYCVVGDNVAELVEACYEWLDLPESL